MTGRLLELGVRDLALIDRLRLELEAGLNVLTGETGAGKSIMVGALSLVLGPMQPLRHAPPPPHRPKPPGGLTGYERNSVLPVLGVPVAAAAKPTDKASTQTGRPYEEHTGMAGAVRNLPALRSVIRGTG